MTRWNHATRPQRFFYDTVSCVGALQRSNQIFWHSTSMTNGLKGFLHADWKQCPQVTAVQLFSRSRLADKRLFMLLAEKTRAGLKAGPSGRPCDLVFEECMNSTEVKSLLQPKPIAVRSRDEEPPLKRLKFDKVAGDRPQSYSGGKGKGKSKGKAAGAQNMRIPLDLLNLGCAGATPQGHRLCFSYNLKKCTSQVQNQRCDKGLHLCAVKGCYKQHPAMDCPAKKKD